MGPRAGGVRLCELRALGENCGLVVMATKGMQVLRREWERVQQASPGKPKGTRQSGPDGEEAPP